MSRSTDSFRLCICGVDCWPSIRVESNTIDSTADCFFRTGRTGEPLAAFTRVGEIECVLSLDILRCEWDRPGRVAICFGGDVWRVGESPSSYRFAEGDRLNS